MRRITKRKMSWTGTAIVLALLLVLASQGAAAQPEPQQEEAVAEQGSGVLAPSSTLISYQGTLTDENGDPISATVTMKFALYDASIDGNLKWGTQTQSVQVTDGLFSVLLGTDPTIDPDDLTGDLWLDIIVNNEQLAPRERITSVPYSVEASTLPGWAQTRGPLEVRGLLTVHPDSGISGLQLLRTDEETRTHKWIAYQMDQQYGMNSFQIWEYRTDSTGKDCGGDPNDGAICVPRFTIWQGGDMRIGSPGQTMNLEVIGNVLVRENLDMDGGVITNVPGILAWPGANLDIAFAQPESIFLKSYATAGAVNIGYGGSVPLSVSGNVSSGGNMTAGGSMAVSGQGFFGGATYAEGAMNLQSQAVPLTFKEVDESGNTVSLWRMPLDNEDLRFDMSTNGTDFSNYITPLYLWDNGSVTCGALTEAGLQTPEEQAAGGSDRFEEGDVLCWGIDQLEKCAAANDRLVQAVADSSGRPIVIGAEVIKVLGPVKRGDILVASSVPGYAMVNNDPVSGSVIAQALEDFDGEQGIIKAMIRKF